MNDWDGIFRRLATLERGDLWVSIEDGMNGMGEMKESVDFLKRMRDRYSVKRSIRFPQYFAVQRTASASRRSPSSTEPTFVPSRTFRGSSSWMIVSSSGGSKPSSMLRPFACTFLKRSIHCRAPGFCPAPGTHWIVWMPGTSQTRSTCLMAPGPSRW